MDQLGISIQHDQDQNVKMAPFYYYPTQETFTLLWPVKDIEAEEQIKRDFLHGMTHEGRRRVLESIWKDMDDDELREIERTSPELPQPKSVSNVPIDMGMFEKKNQGILKVYTDSKMVVTGLSEAADFQDVDDVQFQLVETPDQADICWYTHEHYKDYQNLVLKKQFVNQFRNEHLFTIKAELARAVKGKNLPFTIETYDLAYPRDIAQYILRFREARDNGEKNIWIVKPANLSRSMNMNVVTDEKAPLKLTETGPVIVSKCKLFN
jgi:tubulin--tyrosine ligase-like protein 12